jgi:RNA polymerase-interacting CarD/CdnL/TRCF family regulator
MYLRKSELEMFTSRTTEQQEELDKILEFLRQCQEERDASWRRRVAQ